ncbi:Gfo/Idh/MocA family oxidoreductase [Paenibacillus cisolokensis]|jgi:hypothetical protein|uniref:Gfo/Idh/MocA-like oxidoreductase N-terminal domain-containing protein n=1 Tax=Paenibacillus cisolokensis TaxID=1658519 RepID=A0ABQ4NCW9_9BACL|nr:MULTISPECIES: Gfo/Idh/MocA family oxidoreductase [Paenibacillus]ALS26866.1 NAD(P)-binding domain-containing protein [Paenibacillus sp. 32O-W]GIQ66068.1 hypothetical protein PACILC2_46360 [Paenibacillus cisolokensis]
MKTIGFIDYYLDEWHANQYPAWIANATGGAMRVAYAYGKKDADGGKTNVEWAAEKGVELLDSIEAVVEKSDYLIVLSPDHPDQHEELAELPLRSGKRTYIDKTFAPDRAAALRLFELADKHGTPLFSSSALRFASEYAAAEKQGIDSIYSSGPGRLDNYSIHQIEPIVMLMGAGADRVMYTGTGKFPALLIGYPDGRQASVQHGGWECPFHLTLNYDNGHSAVLKPESDFFQLFIRQLTAFFETGEVPVNPSETVEIISIIEQSLKAVHTPHQWVKLPS